MTKAPSPQVTAETLDTASMCTLEELCSACHVEAEWIASLVEYGVVEPVGKTKVDWQFQSLSIVRIAKAKRLERDLSLNPPGIALALDLLDEIERLRSRLRQIEGLEKEAGEL